MPRFQAVLYHLDVMFLKLIKFSFSKKKTNKRIWKTDFLLNPCGRCGALSFHSNYRAKKKAKPLVMQTITSYDLVDNNRLW